MNQIAAKSRCAKCHIPAFVAIAAEMLYLRGKGVSIAWMRRRSRKTAMATPEENSKLVLAMYKHFHKKPDQVLFARDFQSYVVEKSLDVEDMKSGLAYGYEQKWFEDGPNGTIRLTQAGFDLLPPA
jgi:hypothetical protein